MRTLILSTGLAAALGVFAMGGANAAPIATHGVVAAPVATTDVACRIVKKTTFHHGVKKVVTTRDCGRPMVRGRVMVGPRHHYARPGITVRVR